MIVHAVSSLAVLEQIENKELLNSSADDIKKRLAELD